MLSIDCKSFVLLEREGHVGHLLSVGIALLIRDFANTIGASKVREQLLKACSQLGELSSRELNKSLEAVDQSKVCFILIILNGFVVELNIL